MVLILLVTGCLERLGHGAIAHGVGVRSESRPMSRFRLMTARPITVRRHRPVRRRPEPSRLRSLVRSIPTGRSARNPYLPDIHQYLMPPMHVAKLVGLEATTKPDRRLPASRSTALATGLSNPRSVYGAAERRHPGRGVRRAARPRSAPNRPKEIRHGLGSMKDGPLAPRKPGNRILLASAGVKADGAAYDPENVFLIDNLKSPFGVVLVGDAIFTSPTPTLCCASPMSTGQTRIAAPGTSSSATSPEAPSTTTGPRASRRVRTGPSSTPVWAPTATSPRTAYRRSWTARPSGKSTGRRGAHRLFATGLRNPNGLQFEPASHVLWTVVNERDELGPDLVPDYLTSVKPGAFYGWPYSYYGQHVDPRVMPQPARPGGQGDPAGLRFEFPRRPLGTVFNTGGSLPAQYSGGAFVGEHGSWDRSVLNGYKVVYVPFTGGKPSGATQDVVTGFLTPDDKARGRPVGLAMDAKGGLLIADDVGNTVWRVTAAKP